MTDWYVTSPRYTARVSTDDRGVIVGGPPIVRYWVGQPLSSLLAAWKADKVKRL